MKQQQSKKLLKKVNITTRCIVEVCFIVSTNILGIVDSKTETVGKRDENFETN